MKTTLSARWIPALCATLLTLHSPAVRAEEPAVAAAPRWEVTVGATAKHNPNGWKIAAPEAEIQYQWSERIELTSKMSWAVIKPEGAAAMSGPGMGEIGIKWRFWENEASGFSMALCPQVERFITRASVRRGIVSAQREIALPIETKFRAAGMEFELKTGRKFIEDEPDAWEVELKVARPCAAGSDCNLTLQHKLVPMEPPRTLIKPGRKLNDSFTLKMAVGREVGPRNADRKDLVISVGLMVVY